MHVQELIFRMMKFLSGYYFEYGAKSVHLETIYQVELDNKGVPKNQDEVECYSPRVSL